MGGTSGLKRSLWLALIVVTSGKPPMLDCTLHMRPALTVRAVKGVPPVPGGSAAVARLGNFARSTGRRVSDVGAARDRELVNLSKLLLPSATRRRTSRG